MGLIPREKRDLVKICILKKTAKYIYIFPPAAFLSCFPAQMFQDENAFN